MMQCRTLKFAERYTRSCYWWDEVIHTLLVMAAHFWHNSRMRDEHPTPPAAPPPAPTAEARRIVRRLQGEDGYDIFDDHRQADERERLRRERDDSRW